MITNYDDFIIQETLSEYLPLNESMQISAKLQDAAKNVANQINDNAVQKIKGEFAGKSLKQIIQQIHKVIKDSGAGEFAKNAVGGATSSAAKFVAKKVGEYSTIGLIITIVANKLIETATFGLVSGLLTGIAWKLGIAIMISLVVYIIAKKLKTKLSKSS